MNFEHRSHFDLDIQYLDLFFAYFGRNAMKGLKFEVPTGSASKKENSHIPRLNSQGQISNPHFRTA